MTHVLSYPKDKIKVLLLERINQSAVDFFRDAGFSNIVEIPKSLSEEELMEEMEECYILGIRSKTKVTEEHIKKAKHLLAIGCFGVGTNQVAIHEAAARGIPVFNAPHSSTRSVAELSMGVVIMLARKASERSRKLHSGVWEKSAVGSKEVRHKVLGILGYGHIGQQVGLMAESIGMQVIFYDQLKRLPLGRATAESSMEDVFAKADFVSLHIPANKNGKPVVTANELAKMRKGSYLINFGRGSLVDLGALKEAIESGHLAGAAIDVYPDEPKTNNAEFQCELTGVENVILTPHIGGSTEEAQFNIGREVASALTKFIDSGGTPGAVNFPQVALPTFPDSHRILNIHRNVPGAITEINTLMSNLGVNIDSQYLSTQGDVGYLIMDVDKEVSKELKDNLTGLSFNIRTRILY